MRLDYKIVNHPREDVRYHILPLNRINKTLQHFTITRNREFTGLTHTSTELTLEVTVKS